MAKFYDNLRSSMRGMSPQEVAEYYTKWTYDMQYDKDMEIKQYKAPSIVAREVASCFAENRHKIKIMDIACGTGLVGDELATYGFTNIDGLDPSEGMLNMCMERGHYKNLFKEFCGENKLQIDDCVYDCLLVCGGFGENHIPCSSLIEMIRIVKTDGLVFIVTRKEFIEYVGKDIDELDAFISQLESEGKVEMVQRRIFPKYSAERDGILYKIKVK